MADWTVCPFCQLKHTRRPDGHCPRCKQALDGAVAGDPAEPAEPPLATLIGGAPPDVYDDRPVASPGPPARPAYERASSRTTGGVPTGLWIIGGFFFVAVVVVGGVVALGAGRGLLSSLRYAGQLESTPVAILRGESYQYHLIPGSAKWFLRKKEAARKDNPLADRWIVRPDKDAHVFVIAENVPQAGRVNMDRFVEVVTKNAMATASKFQVIAKEPLSPLISSQLLEVRATFKSQQIHGYYGLYAREPYIYQVIAMASDEEFPGLQAELKQTVSSFEPD